MQDDGSAQSGAVWPLPQFHFVMKVDDIEMSFQEVSGLDVETVLLEYRAGNNAAFSKVKMPRMRRSGNVTLKHGVSARDSAFFDWVRQIKMNTITRKTMTISLMDEARKPTMVWTLQNAFPVKISGTDLHAESNEVAVESVEIACETFTIANA